MELQITSWIPANGLMDEITLEGATGMPTLAASWPVHESRSVVPSIRSPHLLLFAGGAFLLQTGFAGRFGNSRTFPLFRNYCRFSDENA